VLLLLLLLLLLCCSCPAGDNGPALPNFVTKADINRLVSCHQRSS
jgi:hypothetical protein